MSVRRLHPVQPDSFAFTDENLAWARRTIQKYPPGRQASAVIPVLWRAQEQNGGWTSEPAMRYVADLLEMAYIRVLEVATFYTMFQLAPVGRKAHVAVCGTTPCMLRGSQELIEVCRRKIAPKPFALSEDADFSWEEVECLGACVNAPMVQIGKDTYEDLTAESFEAILDRIAAGETPEPGPQNGRQFSMPEGGATSLTDVPPPQEVEKEPEAPPTDSQGEPPNRGGIQLPPSEAARPDTSSQRTAAGIASPSPAKVPPEQERDSGPPAMQRPAEADDLKTISGIGSKIEQSLNGLGIYKWRQIAAWSPDEVEWVDRHLRFKGRILRERWVEQADALSSGGVEEYVRRFGKRPR